MEKEQQNDKENRSMEHYCNVNPNHLQEEQITKIMEEYNNPRLGIISDELLDYKLWSRNLPSRQEHFAEFIISALHPEEHCRILEVGAKNCRVSHILSEKGYRMTCMDIKFPADEPWMEGVSCIKEAFDYRTIDLSGYDYVIAQEPCEATEHIVRACAMQTIPYVMDLCGVPHRFISGEQPEDVWAWYGYLENIDPEHIMLKQHEEVSLVKSFYIKGCYDRFPKS